MATIDKRAGKRGLSYKFTWSGGYALDGTQIRQYMSWKPEPGMSEKRADKEAERQAVLFDEKCSKGQYIDSNVKFADFAERWFKDYVEKQLRSETIVSYKNLLPRTVNAIGHIRLSRLQPHHILSFYDNLEEAGVREDIKYRATINLNSLLKERSLSREKAGKLCGTAATTISIAARGKNVNRQSAQKICAALDLELDKTFEPINMDIGLSPKTIKHYHELISSILSTAVQWQVISANPCERVKAPKLSQRDPKYLDEIQAARLIELLEGEDVQYQTMVRLLLYTGFRRGELCGLEWDDIDFNNRLIFVRRSSLYNPDKGTFTDETKNKSSVRCIKVPAVSIAMLTNYKKWQTERQLRAGDKWQDMNRLFTAWDGRPINPTTFSSWFHQFVERNSNEIPNISLHSLRHTNATLQIAGGVPISTVSDRLGHADTSTTGRIYIHAIQTADAAAAEVLENLLNPSANRELKKG